MGNQRGQGTVLDVDLEGRPPLGEARALLVVLLAALGQAVQAAAPLLARPAVEERDEARVDLDARDDVEALRGDVEAECKRKRCMHTPGILWLAPGRRQAVVRVDLLA